MCCHTPAEFDPNTCPFLCQSVYLPVGFLPGHEHQTCVQCHSSTQLCMILGQILFGISPAPRHAWTAGLLASLRILYKLAMSLWCVPSLLINKMFIIASAVFQCPDWPQHFVQHAELGWNAVGKPCTHNGDIDGTQQHRRELGTSRCGCLRVGP